MENIIIFGLGVSGRGIYRSLKNNPNYNILAFIDNNPKLHNQKYDGKDIFSVDSLKKLNFNKIVYSGIWCESMKKQLLDLNVEESKIWHMDDKEVEFSTDNRLVETDLIVENIYNISNELEIDCYVIGSSLATLFRNKDLSCVADVDLFLISQIDANNVHKKILESEFFKDFEIIKVLYTEDEVLAKRNEIKKIIIKSKPLDSCEEPAIVDLSIADDLKDLYFVRHESNYIYIPKKLCEGKRFYSYKNLQLQIPNKAEEYLELLYGKGWIVPPKKWDQSDYGNLMTPNEVEEYKVKSNA